MGKILIVGPRDVGQALIAAARRFGHSVVVADISDETKALAAALEFSAPAALAAVLAGHGKAALSAAVLARHLGLPGVRPSAVRAARVFKSGADGGAEYHVAGAFRSGTRAPHLFGMARLMARPAAPPLCPTEVVGQIVNGTLDRATGAAIERAVARTLTILGIHHGPFHATVRVSGRPDPCVVDLDVGIPGGHLQGLVQLATGIDLAEVAVGAALGVDVRATPATPSGAAGILYFTGKRTEAEARRLTTQLAALDGVVRFQLESGREAGGFVVVAGPDSRAVEGQLLAVAAVNTCILREVRRAI
jgi:hypothetical protein